MLQGILLVALAAAGLLAPAWSGGLRVATTVAGVALLIGGGALAARGIVDLGAALTPLPRPRDDARLVDRGAYALVRHPVYGGLVIAGLGWALVTASPVAAVLDLALLAFFDVKSRREEAWLVERYPGYAAYRDRTRRLLPGLY